MLVVMTSIDSNLHRPAVWWANLVRKWEFPMRSSNAPFHLLLPLIYFKECQTFQLPHAEVFPVTNKFNHQSLNSCNFPCQLE